MYQNHGCLCCETNRKRTPGNFLAVMILNTPRACIHSLRVCYVPWVLGLSQGAKLTKTTKPLTLWFTITDLGSRTYKPE